jgi:broad specificity polyphosphatase/5'/3'-nucleotidase SurE
MAFDYNKFLAENQLTTTSRLKAKALKEAQFIRVIKDLKVGDKTYKAGEIVRHAEDFHAIDEGCISITPMQLDLSHHARLAAMRSNGWDRG